MNLRTIKKRCKAAVDVLVREHGYRLDQFQPADGSEALYAPLGLESRYVRRNFIDPGPLKGTMLYWYRCSYEYDEWDCKLASEVLEDIEHYAKMSASEFAN